ncbi:glutathione S-transferase 4-like [Dermacentor variabilis]|uniref:glutathione S-transferase 4-like n=1 Tax=Dermacentor variabilis TaxID=34621 RepID=UPI003F5C00D0
MAITLYNLAKSPPCAFVRSLAKHLAIEMKIKNLDFAKKEHFSDEYLKVNPFHKVPAIDDEGFIVYESNAIAYYLLRKYAPDSKLYPACIKTRTRIDQVLACLSSTIHSAMVAFLLPRFVEKTKPKAEEKSAFEDNVLRGLENLIGDKFTVGDTFTLADLAMTSFVAAALENNLVDYTKFSKLRSYYERVKHEQPCFEEIYGPVLDNMRQLSANLK